MAFNPDDKKLGKYQIVRELGRGAMGVVYEGYDPVLERHVALKTIRKDLLQSGNNDTGNLLQRFRREAQAAARLHHPNIVVVHDYAEEDDTVFIAMERVNGKELKDYFAQKLRFDLKSSVKIMLQLLDGLAYSHQHNIVHRDIKPANIILIENSGRVKIADFGVARMDASELTQAGEIMGTPAYMAPEQLLGNPVDARVDIYSAGVIFYELLTGEKPFTGNNIPALMNNILHAEPPAASQRNVKLPPQCDGIVNKALSKDPGARYQTAEAFKAALKALFEAPAAVVPAVPTPAPVVAAPPPPTNFSKGILGDLKKEAEQARQAKEAEADRQARLEEVYRRELCPRLLAIHGYLFDLVEQLNTLSWTVTAEYEFPGIGKVGGLKQEDYRIRIDSTDSPKRVVLTFVCRAPEERRYGVSFDKSDETHKFFVTQQIKYIDWPVRTPSGQTQEIIYQARLQIMVTIMCQADIAKSKLVVTVANLDGVSAKRHEFDAEEIDEEWLDKLGNYILRKLDNFGKMYITDDERRKLREHLAQEKARIESETSQQALNEMPEPQQNAKPTEAYDGDKTSLLKGLRKKLFTQK
ncbi:MAG: serine/threonine protein kinase [Methylococcaceae bacterium]|nr:MAG: serine/threonine protein kinase [Methylococcaceae bacterium]